jgi:cyanophycinase-like exopeptidase
MAGAIALVGSGEYLPHMESLERDLVAAGHKNGKSPTFVQLATAAGRESAERLQYWKDLGAKAAQRIGVESVFLPIFDSQSANQTEYLDAIENAGLIYLSGGDPNYLARVLVGSQAGRAILQAWESGSSLAGCSAGAMAMGSTVPEIFSLRKSNLNGLGVSGDFQVLPHYDRYFGWASDKVVKFVSGLSNSAVVIGIDEDTALFRVDSAWEVFGRGQVHCLSEAPIRVLQSGDRY